MKRSSVSVRTAIISRPVVMKTETTTRAPSFVLIEKGRISPQVSVADPSAEAVPAAGVAAEAGAVPEAALESGTGLSPDTEPEPVPASTPVPPPAWGGESEPGPTNAPVPEPV
ncbi:hypothetical protein GCM10010306_011950 [Streptomyces umbrinus]|nr:hypothetical protein GCM10010306_011950 [Streptomyces umbrinus]